MEKETLEPYIIIRLKKGPERLNILSFRNVSTLEPEKKIHVKVYLIFLWQRLFNLFGIKCRNQEGNRDEFEFFKRCL